MFFWTRLVSCATTSKWSHKTEWLLLFGWLGFVSYMFHILLDPGFYDDTLLRSSLLVLITDMVFHFIRYYNPTEFNILIQRWKDMKMLLPHLHSIFLVKPDNLVLFHLPILLDSYDHTGTSTMWFKIGSLFIIGLVY